jgi:hypothetical protein
MLGAFWPLIRDLTTHTAYTIQQESGGARESRSLIQEFREMLGPKRIQQREKYETYILDPFMKKWTYEYSLLDYVTLLASSPLSRADFALIDLEVDDVMERARGVDLCVFSTLESDSFKSGIAPIDYHFFRDSLQYYLRRLARTLLMTESMSDGLRSTAGLYSIKSLFAGLTRWDSIATSRICTNGMFLQVQG